MAYKWALGLSLGVIQSVAYFGAGHLEMARSTELLRTALDDALPFWPWTAWFYLPFYVGVFAVCISGIRSRAILHRGCLGVLGVMLVGLACHLLIPAEYPRPVLHAPYPDLSTAFMAAVQRIDPPGNVFPSLHVAQTSALAFILFRDRRGLGLVAIVMATILALSTLTTKQHFVADIVAGYVIAFVTRHLVLRGLPRR